MKYCLWLLLLCSHIPSLLPAQTIRDLDDATSLYKSASPKAGLLKSEFAGEVVPTEADVRKVEELTATIEGVLFENGDRINIARQRGVPCLKADADIATFAQFTKTENEKKLVAADCCEAQLIRFSFLDDKDFELAQSIDFGILKQFPKLKYVVFYVAPSVYKQQDTKQQKDRVKAKLEEIVGKQIDTESLKFFYRIPRGG